MVVKKIRWSTWRYLLIKWFHSSRWKFFKDANHWILIVAVVVFFLFILRESSFKCNCSIYISYAFIVKKCHAKEPLSFKWMLCCCWLFNSLFCADDDDHWKKDSQSSLDILLICICWHFIREMQKQQQRKRKFPTVQYKHTSFQYI